MVFELMMYPVYFDLVDDQEKKIVDRNLYAIELVYVQVYPVDVKQQIQ
jgi:hypothetical protein